MFPNLNFGAGFAKEIVNEKAIIYSMASFGYSHFRSKDVGYSNPEIGVIIREGSVGKLNAKYVKYLTSNSYKYNSVMSFEQSFFLQEGNLVFSYKIIDSDIEKSFKAISLEYQYHF
jgi:hypothetical protein